MEDDDYEWDDAKADANYKKHRIRFRQAADVFEDPFVQVEPDLSDDYGEDRHKATGMAGGRLVTTIFTERGSRIRIISARRASTDEQRKYHRS